MKRENGNFAIESVACAEESNNKFTNQLKVNESIRTLGAYMFPKLHWDRQFQATKEKITESIAKLNNT